MENKGKKSNYCDRCGDFHDSELEFVSFVRVGEPVPDYEFEALAGNETKTVKLSDYRGKWLLVMFYPADFSGVCGSELRALTEAYPEFQNLGAEALTFSTDSIHAHEAWKKAEPEMSAVPFLMGADPGGRIAYAFGVLVENDEPVLAPGEGLALRGSFLIDPAGTLRTMEVHPAKVARSIPETLRKLRALQFVDTGSGNTCPAGWEPKG